MSGAVPVPLGEHGAFAAILDGHVDPNRLELRARLRDGSVAVVRDDTATLVGGLGQVLTGPRDAPWQDAGAVRAQLNGRVRPVPIRGTEQTGAPVHDPAGGPDWAFRTWQASGPEPFASSRRPSTLSCAVFGPVVDGVVRSPHGAAAGPDAAEPLGFRPLNGCALASLRPRATRDPTHPWRDTEVNYFTSPHVYVDDPAGATPRIARVVLSSVYPGAVAATVIGLPGGRQLPAAVGPPGAVLALLPPAAAEHTDRLRLRLKIDDGTTITTGYQSAPFKRDPVARAVDPKGGATWGVRAQSLRYPSLPGLAGQIVGRGELGRIDDRTGEIISTTGTSGTFSAPLTRRHPVNFGTDVQFDTASDGRPSPADVARRTLPGRTILTGAAVRGVTRVTIHTPRDVRTVRPAKRGGLFVVVYDGHFTRGRITVVAEGPGIHGLAQRPADPYF